MNFKYLAVASVTVTLALVAGCVVQPNQSLTGSGGAGVGGAGSGQGPGSGPGSGLPTSTGTGTGESDARKFYVSDVHPPWHSPTRSTVPPS